MTDGPVGELNEPLMHYPYASLGEYFAKLDRYSRWWAEQSFARGRRTSALTIALRPPARFFSMYVLRAGFLDGGAGVIVAALAAMSVAAKYARLWETAERKMSDPPAGRDPVRAQGRVRRRFAPSSVRLAALDWRTAGNIGARIGALGYRPLGIRRRVVERQIAAAFPGLKESGVRRIARASYEHLGRSSIEAADSPAARAGRGARLVRRRRQLRRRRGCPAARPGADLRHRPPRQLGAGRRRTSRLAACPLDVVARRMSNPLFDRYLTENALAHRNARGARRRCR